MKIVPVNDHLLVERLKAEEKVGRLYLPGNVKEQQVGVIVSVSQVIHKDYGATNDPIYKPGMKVLFSKYAGFDAEIGTHTVFLVKKEEVLAIIEDADGEPA